MSDHQIKEVLHTRADHLALPERFSSPIALVRAAAERRRRVRGRLVGVAASVLVLATSAGLTVAAQGGLFGNTRQAVADAQQVAEAARQAEAAVADVGALTLSYPVADPHLTDRFGPRKHPETGETSLHAGIDFATPSGEPVKAAADGLVAAAGAYPELGNVVVITHGKVQGKAVSTWYAYSGDLRVGVGQRVKQGDVIALAGTSGASSGPHIHFEVRVDGDPVDPTKWLPR